MGKHDKKVSKPVETVETENEPWGAAEKPAPSIDEVLAEDTVTPEKKTRKPRTPSVPRDQRLKEMTLVERSVYFAKFERARLAEIQELAELVGPKAVERARETD